MSDYLAFVYGGIAKASGNAMQDGIDLANKCLDRLNTADNESLPPKLLILLASPAYLELGDAKLLLKGVHKAFKHHGNQIHLIGSSVAGVFFDDKIHPTGALLICLASNLIDVSTSHGTNARENPKRAVGSLLNRLKLNSSKRRIDPNPLANRLLVTFMPGCNQAFAGEKYYPAQTLHDELYKGVQGRIMLAGGVSSASDPSRQNDGFQFVGNHVKKDWIVAASVITGVPIGVGLNDALEPTGRGFWVAGMAPDDDQVVMKFGGGKDKEEVLARDALQEVVRDYGGMCMIQKITDTEGIVDGPLIQDDGSIKLLRSCKRGDYFRILKPGTKLGEILKKGVEDAKLKVFLSGRPLANLLFVCNSYNKGFGIDPLEKGFTWLRENVKRKKGWDIPCLGGFFGGEIGVDEKGKSQLKNGGTCYLTFGDEMRERTPLYKGAAALETLGPKLISIPKLEDRSNYEKIISRAVQHALEIVRECGFPGSMISLIFSNIDRSRKKDAQFIIAQKPSGRRFEKIRKEINLPLDGDSILARVAVSGKPALIMNTKIHPACDETWKKSGLVSQYILPLKKSDDQVFGLLQIDLGDMSRLSEDEFRDSEKARMLNCLAAVIGADISNISVAIENHVMVRLDEALKTSLSAKSLLEGLKSFTVAAGNAFGAQVERLWLVNPEENQDTPRKLVLEASIGAGYKSEDESWREVGTHMDFPISHAFRAKSPQIINLTAKDPVWISMCEKAQSNEVLHRSLSKVKSYAAVSFSAKKEKVGAISFSSTKPWFFLSFHQKTLKMLASKLGFLIEHLDAKIQREFLNDVTTNLSGKKLSEKIFNSIVEDFALALDAKAASLYLLDKDRDKYVLRAEYGWDDGNWVNAAQYPRRGGWMGSIAIDKAPLYTRDLREFYISRDYEHPEGRYSIPMFKRPLSDDFPVEAIGLPLQIGPEEHHKIGVLAFYRRVEKGQHQTGFRSINIDLLQQGAYYAAGLVNAVLQQRNDMWEKNEDKRMNETHRAITADNVRSFETKTCEIVLDRYKAAEVLFYRTGDIEAAKKPYCVAIRRSYKVVKPDDGKIGREDLRMFRETINKKGSIVRYDVAIKRRRTKKKGQLAVSEQKVEGMVEKVCIPLIKDKKHLGALIIRWNLNPANTYSNRYKHKAISLARLGRMIGTAYWQHQMNENIKQTDLAIRATNAFAAQRTHLLRETLQQILNRSSYLHKGQSEIDKMMSHVNEAVKIVRAMTSLGNNVLHTSCRPHSLARLIRSVFELRDGFLKTEFDRLKVKIPYSIPETIWVNVDANHTKDILFNLIHNATDAIIRKKKLKHLHEPPRVEITVSQNGDNKTVLVIKDNGIGMTNDEKENALQGFVIKKKGEGVGVLIASMLLSAQGGALEYKSTKTVGTETIITFSSAEWSQK